MIIIEIGTKSIEYKRERDVYASAMHMKRSVACFAREGFYPDWKTACTWQAILMNG